VVQLETQLVINGRMLVILVFIVMLILIHVLHEEAVVMQVKLVVEVVVRQVVVRTIHVNSLVGYII
jgi:hypothetical protein